MKTSLPAKWVLLGALLAGSALAEGREQPGVRSLFLSSQPDAAPQRVYVKGQRVTVLRFAQAVDVERTRLLGGEGRFEPLGIVGRKVILEPRQDLASDEGFSLVVTLADGREIPFLLRPHGQGEGRGADQQLDVFDDHQSCEASVAALRDSAQENRALRAELEKLRKEETSEDHALAALMASGSVAQTPFTLADHFSGKDEDAALDGSVFRGNGKAAVVFKVKNLNATQPWSVKTVRLVGVSDARERAVALRLSAAEIAPGTSGVVALVADGSAFLDEGTLTSLFLELYRQDGLRQAMVQLDPHLIGK
ncbi:DUF2381 family protein [Corallococcus praedator]|uniref:DUF2381 family protein n=1 Tax=Corallococcus praedator TaxID=2316724 RepID=A0ABX9QQ56_9BACT|nr:MULTISPECIES: DUF2381 family protein [Corallococcus]RKH32723.1 DUF2381 family protein [Corallococcus sp. CA031C]RKI14161.1 DUF2381 family protein [Corallococcus praedator]